MFKDVRRPVFDSANAETAVVGDCSRPTDGGACFIIEGILDHLARRADD